MAAFRFRAVIALLCLALATCCFAITATPLEKTRISSSLSLEQLDDELQVRHSPAPNANISGQTC